MNKRRSFFDPEPDDSERRQAAEETEAGEKTARHDALRDPSVSSGPPDDPEVTRPFRPVRPLNSPEDMPALPRRPADAARETSPPPESSPLPQAPADHALENADPERTQPLKVPPTLVRPPRPQSKESLEATQPPARPSTPVQPTRSTTRPPAPGPASKPAPASASRPTPTSASKPAPAPEPRRPARSHTADPGATQIHRPAEDANANTIPPRRVETTQANPGKTKKTPPSWSKRGFILMWWGAQAALAVVVGAVVFDRIVMPLVVRQGQEVVIPAVDGLAVDRATELLVEAGLEPIEAPGKYSALLARGQVLEASPTPGLSVKRGRQVFLTPSLGMENRLVPDVEGLSLRLAGVRLQETGLKVGDVHYTSTDRVRPGEVIASAPAQGSPMPNAGTVSLLLAREKAPVPFWLPDLTGRAGVETAAWLEACGFKVFIYETAFPGTPGTVVRQRPPAGEPIWPTDRIDLTVAREGASYDDEDPFDRYDRNGGDRDASDDGSQEDSRSGSRTNRGR